MGLANSSIYSAAKPGDGFHQIPRQRGDRQRHQCQQHQPRPRDTGFLRSSNLLKSEQTPPEFIAGVPRDIPLGRMTTPRDIGCVAAFLASDVAADIVGQVIHVDGGKIIKF